MRTRTRGDGDKDKKDGDCEEGNDASDEGDDDGEENTSDDDDGEAYHVFGRPVRGDEDDLYTLGLLVKVLDGRHGLNKSFSRRSFSSIMGRCW